MKKNLKFLFICFIFLISFNVFSDGMVFAKKVPLEELPETVESDMRNGTMGYLSNQQCFISTYRSFYKNSGLDHVNIYATCIDTYPNRKIEWDNPKIPKGTEKKTIHIMGKNTSQRMLDEMKKGKNAFDVDSVLVDTKRPIAIVPNLAIHMNRSVNDGVKLNRQKEMLPILMMERNNEDNPTKALNNRNNPSLFSESDTQYDEWTKFLADEVDCDPSEILSYEMTLYPTEQGCVLGTEGDFISSPRLDNLTSCFGVLSGIIQAKKMNVNGVRCAILFDNEEVGSRTKQGGAGMILPNLVKRVYDALGYSNQEMDSFISKGFMISSDVAHGLHPNYPEKNDITNIPVLNKGLSLKIACSQSYAGDAKAIAIVKGLCEEADAQYQIYVNRSDIPGGSTVGSISSAMLPMRTIDVGLPLLAMHSARELMGAADQEQLNRLMNHFLGGK